MIGHTTSLSKFKTEIIPSIFSDHNSMKLEIKNTNKVGKFTNMETKQYIPEQAMCWKSIYKKRNKNILKQMEMHKLKPMECFKSSPEKEVYSNKCLHLKKKSNKQPHFILKDKNILGLKLAGERK